MLGDSKVIIDWLKTNGRLQATNIEGWKTRIQELKATFQNISFHHIYRDSNEEADKLSKWALFSPKGRLIFFTWDGKNEGPFRHLDFF
jgi:hypothetical protein